MNGKKAKQLRRVAEYYAAQHQLVLRRRKVQAYLALPFYRRWAELVRQAWRRYRGVRTLPSRERLYRYWYKRLKRG